jgi:hypothetical protein
VISYPCPRNRRFDPDASAEATEALPYRPVFERTPV